MPIIKDSAPVIYPNEDLTLVRYMDLGKFLSLLVNQSLFFCRLDKLEDHFEGTTPKANYNFRIEQFKYLRDTGYFKDEITDEEIPNKILSRYEFEKKFRSLNCVSCWNSTTKESAALWKIYSDNGQGIMIQTSRNSLIQAFEQSEEKIIMSLVNYIDYQNDRMIDGNSIFPIIHKDSAYEYEQELRLIHEVKPKVGWDYNWEDEEIEFGKNITVNLDKLIEKIVLGPFAPPWYSKIIKDLIVKYRLNVDYEESYLSEKRF